MTIIEVIRKVDQLRPNRFTREQKIEWLAQIEGQIYNEVVRTHENPMGIRKPRIDVNTDPDTHLIAPFPYDELYISWIESQIDLNNMEIGKYNNDHTMFNNSYMTFRDYWNRTFMPCERAGCFVFDQRRVGVPYDGHPLFSSGNALDVDESAKGDKVVPCKPKPLPMGNSDEDGSL